MKAQTKIKPSFKLKTTSLAHLSGLTLVCAFILILTSAGCNYDSAHHSEQYSKTYAQLTNLKAVENKSKDLEPSINKPPFELNPSFEFNIMAGGNGTVEYQPFASFMLPLANLPNADKTQFYSGRALAHQPWVKAPSSTTARDGLGPLYNARTCLACHVNGGRGLLPSDNKSRLNNGVVRLSIEGFDKYKGVVPEPVYGEQLQTQSTALAHQLGLKNYGPNEVKAEANVYIDWQYQTHHYVDGSTQELRAPKLNIKNLAYGELAKDVKLSFRNAPALTGVGLIEQISATDLVLNAKKQQSHPTISGRLNQVWDLKTQQNTIGRFGWKANQPSLLVQTAAAFHADVGISSSLFSKQPCSLAQANCLAQATGVDKSGFEINDKLLNQVTYFIQHIGVPKARLPKQDKQQFHQLGQTLFASLDCVVCHKPSYTTQAITKATTKPTTKASSQFPALVNQKIWPYSDFLLHDMGEKLADNRTDYQASGSEWRTPPLWGLGLSKQVNGSQLLLHDGRARNVEEAILWHGGEAEHSKNAFNQLTKIEREALIFFVESL